MDIEVTCHTKTRTRGKLIIRDNIISREEKYIRIS